MSRASKTALLWVALTLLPCACAQSGAGSEANVPPGTPVARPVPQPAETIVAPPPTERSYKGEGSQH